MSDVPPTKPAFRDGIEGATVASSLPAIALGPGLVVRESHFAGSYYCGHLHFLTQRLARSAEAPFVVDDAGDPCAGFIHVPADAQALGQAPAAANDPKDRPRYEQLVQVLALVLTALPLRARRVLVTGFGPFRDVDDNPTGAFVGAPAWIARLAQVSGRDVRGVVLPVDDGALDGGAASLQAALQAHAPDALIALGVHRGSEFRVETRADSSGLRLSPDGAIAHDDTSTNVESMPENRALWRALVRAVEATGSGQS